MVEKFTEASMFAAGGVHYAHGAMLSLWDPPWVSGPHVSATEVGVDVIPSLCIGKTELIWG